MATYLEIQKYIKSKYGFTAQTCWIADIKEQSGLSVKVAHNRYNNSTRTKSCPADKKNAIIDAFKHFSMIK